MNPYLILWSILNHVTIFIITADIYRFWFYHRLLLITGMSWGRRIIYNFVTKLLSIRKNLRIVRDVLEKGWKNRSIPRGFIRRGCFIKYSSMLCGSFFSNIWKARASCATGSVSRWLGFPACGEEGNVAQAIIRKKKSWRLTWGLGHVKSFKKPILKFCARMPAVYSEYDVCSGVILSYAMIPYHSFISHAFSLLFVANLYAGTADWQHYQPNTTNQLHKIW